MGFLKTGGFIFTGRKKTLGCLPRAPTRSTEGEGRYVGSSQSSSSGVSMISESESANVRSVIHAKEDGVVGTLELADIGEPSLSRNVVCASVWSYGIDSLGRRGLGLSRMSMPPPGLVWNAFI